MERSRRHFECGRATLNNEDRPLADRKRDGSSGRRELRLGSITVDARHLLAGNYRKPDLDRVVGPPQHVDGYAPARVTVVIGSMIAVMRMGRVDVRMQRACSGKVRSR